MPSRIWAPWRMEYTNFMPVLADVRVMPEHLEETYAKLAPFFADLAT